jgi:hypothetical protein
MTRVPDSSLANRRAANYCRTSDKCPTKFGKCPSKSNFDRTLVRSQKQFVTLYIFLLWQNPIANLHFAIRHSINVAPEWLYILVSWLIYILWRIYVRPNLVMLVFVRPSSSYVRPKLKVIGQMSCQVKYLFAALKPRCLQSVTEKRLWVTGYEFCYHSRSFHRGCSIINGPIRDGPIVLTPYNDEDLVWLRFAKWMIVVFSKNLWRT